MYLLRDMALICNVIRQGRYSGFGLLDIKDIISVATLVDTLVRFLTDNMRALKA